MKRKEEKKKEEDKKIENIFLAYANYSLREDPSNFGKILNVIGEYTSIDLRGIDKLNELFCEIAKCKNVQTLLPFLYPAVQADVKGEEGPSQIDDLKYLLARIPVKATEINLSSTSIEELFHLAELHRDDESAVDPMKIINAFYGRRRIKHDQHSKFEWNCKCKLRPNMKAIIGKDLCNDPFKLKCCDCHQYVFIKMLWYIEAGANYNDVKDFNKHAQMAKRIRPETIYFPERKYPYILIKATAWLSLDKILMNYELSEFLNAIATYSLLEFITQDERNRERLKICPLCGLFFVKKRHRDDQRFCSETCRKSWNNHKPGAKEKLNEFKREKRKQGAKQSYY
jgi:hypothetical protein